MIIEHILQYFFIKHKTFAGPSAIQFYGRYLDKRFNMKIEFCVWLIKKIKNLSFFLLTVSYIRQIFFSLQNNLLWKWLKPSLFKKYYTKNRSSPSAAYFGMDSKMMLIKRVCFHSVVSETWPTQHPSQWTLSIPVAVRESFAMHCPLEGSRILCIRVSPLVIWFPTCRSRFC